MCVGIADGLFCSLISLGSSSKLKLNIRKQQGLSVHSDDDSHAKCMQTHATMVVQYGVLHTNTDKLCTFKCCGRTQD